jgi:hypothetical protein
MTNSKTKGATFERKIATLLSSRFQLLTGIKTSFRKSPDSGSYFGGTNKKRTTTHDLNNATFGDLLCPKNFKFSIECKHYKTPPTFNTIVKGVNPQWDTWIAQATQDAVNSQKQLMLIIKYNSVAEIVGVTTELPDLIPILKYKNIIFYRLEDILTLPDSFFFT